MKPSVPGSGDGGPGLWEDWLGDLRREGLIEALLAGGVIARAVAEADHGHRLDRTLTAKGHRHVRDYGARSLARAMT